MAADQIWTLEHEGRQHRVEASGSTAHVVRWYVDDELLAEKKTWDDKVSVEAPGEAAEKLLVRYSGLGKPRRATLLAMDDDVAALAGLGGVDLVPAPGSAAERHEKGILEHPTRYAVLATLGGVAKVVVPILIGLVVVRFAVNLPFPNLPRIPTPDLPDLPSVPWPSIPLPDLPDWQLPDWVRWLLDKVKYVWPVVLAFVLARAEIKRRRAQEERRRAAERD